MSSLTVKATQPAAASAAKTWLRALELTAPIARNPERLLSTVVAEMGQQFGSRLALLSERECFSYRELAARSNRYARWALDQGLSKGNVVALLMTNRPEYIAIWLGITSVGAVVALLNTNLVGPSLAHCIATARPKHLIVCAELMDGLTGALSALDECPQIWSYGVEAPGFARIDTCIEGYSDRLVEPEKPRVTIHDRALFIYTSGTTGLPKAANLSHARVMQWSYWFAGMMGVAAEDRIYNCLPMYHSVGGVQVPGAMLVAGASAVLRDKFSARRFWAEVVRWDCTLLQYIGELCRYLLNAAPSPEETAHRIRLACGNGLAPAIWDTFKERFGIPQLLEFYAATEGGVSLFNVAGEPGAIGQTPAWLGHRFSPALVRVDLETQEPVRNEQGLCIRSACNEVGEAIGKVVEDRANVGSRFEGYTDPQASDKKFIRNVFEAGDVWVRTGDLMRRDERGFFYFVDRIGDTFRWKGENVATPEVAEAIACFRGVQYATAYGVAVPGCDGRAGMAAVVVNRDFDLGKLPNHLSARLAAFARPLFLRLRGEIEVTGTFKYARATLVCEGYDPAAIQDQMYFYDREMQRFVPLDGDLFARIQAGQLRL